MPRIKIPQAWVEIHCRIHDTVPTCSGDLRASDYVMCGGPIPHIELRCASDVYMMFKTIPQGFESWFSRPVRFYDVVTLCRPLKNGRVIPHPLIILQESEALKFNISGQPITRPVDYEAKPNRVVPGVVLVAHNGLWESKRRSG